MPISSDSTGLAFLAECFKTYWGAAFYLIIFLLAMVWIAIAKRKKTSSVFLHYLIFLALTVYNPFLVTFIVKTLGISLEYYRFLWILPVIPALAYTAVCISELHPLLIPVLALGIVLAGVPIEGVVHNFSKADNIYKVPDDLIQVCSSIHTLSDQENGSSYQPIVVFESDYNMQVRQYDASIRLALRRDSVLVYCGSQSVKVKTDALRYKCEAAVMRVIYSGDDSRLKAFRKGLKALKADYVVVSADSPFTTIASRTGLQEAARTQSHIIYEKE